MDQEDYRAIVLGVGNGNVKVGFGGEEKPFSVVDVQSILGSGKTALTRGEVTDWDQIEKVWRHSFDNLIKVDPESHPLLLMEPPLNPKPCREKTTELTFETFEFPAMYVAVDGVLVLYAAGRTTGTILHSGYGLTFAMCVSEGYYLPQSIRKKNYGGDDLTKQLIANHFSEGAPKRIAGQSPEGLYQIVDEIKRKHCFIPLEENVALEGCHNARTIREALDKGRVDQDSLFNRLPVELISQVQHYSFHSKSLGEYGRSYKLPDGQTLWLEEEMFKAPCSILFDPEEGLVHTAVDSIHYMENDVHDYKHYWGNIIISGGNMCVPGIADRLHKEMMPHLPRPNFTLKVIAPPERQNSDWLGGSILASLSTFAPMYISKEEYDESGPAIVHRKCF